MRRNIDGVVTLTAPYLKLSVLGSVSSAGSSTLKDAAPENGIQVKSDDNQPSEPTGIYFFENLSSFCGQINGLIDDGLLNVKC